MADLGSGRSAGSPSRSFQDHAHALSRAHLLRNRTIHAELNYAAPDSVAPELLQLLSFLNSAFLRLPSAAILIFLSAAARAWVVATYFWSFSSRGWDDQLEFIAVFVAMLFTGQAKMLPARHWTCRSSCRLSRARGAEEC